MDSLARDTLRDPKASKALKTLAAISLTISIIANIAALTAAAKKKDAR